MYLISNFATATIFFLRGLRSHHVHAICILTSFNGARIDAICHRNTIQPMSTDDRTSGLTGFNLKEELLEIVSLRFLK